MRIGVSAKRSVRSKRFQDLYPGLPGQLTNLLLNSHHPQTGEARYAGMECLTNAHEITLRSKTCSGRNSQ
jgi:hypothetical protein